MHGIAGNNVAPGEVGILVGHEVRDEAAGGVRDRIEGAQGVARRSAWSLATASPIWFRSALQGSKHSFSAPAASIAFGAPGHLCRS